MKWVQGKHRTHSDLGSGPWWGQVEARAAHLEPTGSADAAVGQGSHPHPKAEHKVHPAEGLAWWSVTVTSGVSEAGIQLPLGNTGRDREQHPRLVTLNQMQPWLGTGPFGCTTARGVIYVPVNPRGSKKICGH